jgi:hypothetical protein
MCPIVPFSGLTEGAGMIHLVFREVAVVAGVSQDDEDKFLTRRQEEESVSQSVLMLLRMCSDYTPARGNLSIVSVVSRHDSWP